MKNRILSECQLYLELNNIFENPNNWHAILGRYEGFRAVINMKQFLNTCKFLGWSILDTRLYFARDKLCGYTITGNWNDGDSRGFEESHLLGYGNESPAYLLVHMEKGNKIQDVLFNFLIEIFDWGGAKPESRILSIEIFEGNKGE